MSNPNDDLLDRLDQDFAPGWQPAPGDKIAGVITEITHRDGGWGLYPIIELDIGDTTARGRDGEQVTGRVAVHAMHGVLKGELEQRRPGVGDRIAIKYLGKQHGKSGTDYEGYKVAHEPKDPTSAWGTPAATAPSSAGPANFTTPDGEEPF